MSVTRPTLKLLALDELELVLDDPPLLELLLLLLLPQAASTRATATTARTPRPNGLFLHPVTPSPFDKEGPRNLSLREGPTAIAPNVSFIHADDRGLMRRATVIVLDACGVG